MRYSLLLFAIFMYHVFTIILCVTVKKVKLEMAQRLDPGASWLR